MNTIDSDKPVVNILEALGLTKITDNSFYKESDNILEYNYCRFYLFQNEFLTIRVGNKSRESACDILSMYYIKNLNDLIDTISRFGFLKHLFPDIVCVPEININNCKCL